MPDLAPWAPTAVRPTLLAGGVGATAIWEGTGVPSNALGTDGDYYFRIDGAAGAAIYQRRAGAWVATAA